MKVKLGKAVLWEKIYQRHLASWDGRAMEICWVFFFLCKQGHVDILHVHKCYADANAFHYPTTMCCSNAASPLWLRNKCDISWNDPKSLQKKDNFSSFASSASTCEPNGAQRHAHASLRILGASQWRAAGAGMELHRHMWHRAPWHGVAQPVPHHSPSAALQLSGKR